MDRETHIPQVNGAVDNSVGSIDVWIVCHPRLEELRPLLFQDAECLAKNFEHDWEAIKALNSKRPCDEKLWRMWNYYLLSCKAAFDVENLQLWQIVMSKKGIRDAVYGRVNLRT